MLSQPKWLPPRKLKRTQQRWWAALGVHHVAELQPKRPFRQRGAAEMAARRAETAKKKGLQGAFQIPQATKMLPKRPFWRQRAAELAASQAGTAETVWAVPNGESVRIARPRPASWPSDLRGHRGFPGPHSSRLAF